MIVSKKGENKISNRIAEKGNPLSSFLIINNIVIEENIQMDAANAIKKSLVCELKFSDKVNVVSFSIDMFV